MKKLQCLMGFVLAAVLCCIALAGCGGVKETVITDLHNPENVKYSDFEPMITKALEETGVNRKPKTVEIESWTNSFRRTSVRFHLDLGFDLNLIAICTVQQFPDGPEYALNEIYSLTERGFANSSWVNGADPFYSNLMNGKVQQMSSQAMCDYLNGVESNLLKLYFAEKRTSRGTSLEVIVNEKTSIGNSENKDGAPWDEFFKIVGDFATRFEKDDTYDEILFTTSYCNEFRNHKKTAAYITVRLVPKGGSLVSALTSFMKDFDKNDHTYSFYLKDLYWNTPYFMAHDINTLNGWKARPLETGDINSFAYSHSNGAAYVMTIGKQAPPPIIDPLGVLDKDVMLASALSPALPEDVRFILKTKQQNIFVIPVSNDLDPQDLREAYRNIMQVSAILMDWNTNYFVREHITFIIVTDDGREIFQRYFDWVDNESVFEYSDFMTKEDKSIMQPIIDEVENAA